MWASHLVIKQSQKLLKSKILYARLEWNVAKERKLHWRISNKTWSEEKPDMAGFLTCMKLVPEVKYKYALYLLPAHCYIFLEKFLFYHWAKTEQRTSWLTRLQCSNFVLAMTVSFFPQCAQLFHYLLEFDIKAKWEESAPLPPRAQRHAHPDLGGAHAYKQWWRGGGVSAVHTIAVQSRGGGGGVHSSLCLCIILLVRVLVTETVV
jgi:hypothetical protein